MLPRNAVGSAWQAASQASRDPIFATECFMRNIWLSPETWLMICKRHISWTWSFCQAPNWIETTRVPWRFGAPQHPPTEAPKTAKAKVSRIATKKTPIRVHVKALSHATGFPQMGCSAGARTFPKSSTKVVSGWSSSTASDAPSRIINRFAWAILSRSQQRCCIARWNMTWASLNARKSNLEFQSLWTLDVLWRLLPLFKHLHSPPSP